MSKWGEESRVKKVGEWGRGKQGGRGKVERSGIGWKIEDGEWRVESREREWRVERVIRMWEVEGGEKPNTDIPFSHTKSHELIKYSNIRKQTATPSNTQPLSSACASKI